MKTQSIHILTLLVILITGSLSFWYVRPDKTLQFAVGVVMSLSYIAWGLIHHMIRRDLHKKIIVEYFLVGIIAIVVLFVLIHN